MKEQTRIFLASLAIMLVVSAAITGLCSFLLYKTALEEQKMRLLEFVQSRARLFSAVEQVISQHNIEMRRAKYHSKAGELQVDHKAILKSMDSMGEEWIGAVPPSKIRKTVLNYVVAEKRDGKIFFLYNSRGMDMAPVAAEKMADKPMSKALNGETGVKELRDHLGNLGITAYAPLTTSGLAIVAKIKEEDIQAPFIKTAALVSSLAFLFILVGGVIMRKTVSPLVAKLEETLLKLKESQTHILHQEKMAAIGQLAAGVAHEINNPLGFIASNLRTLGKYTDRFCQYIAGQNQLIASSAHPEMVAESKKQRKKLKIDYITEDAQDLLQESLDGTERISRIVKGLKSFSRQDEDAFTVADINEHLENAVNIVWNELKYKAEVEKVYGQLPLTKCYPHELSQVFINLLVNAAHAIEKFGKIAVKTWSQDDSIWLTITDNGAGISPEHIKRIFEPFYTTKEVGKGTGLGLSISYDIITQKHHGEITVESEVGRGTTFTVQIPVVTDE